MGLANFSASTGAVSGEQHNNQIVSLLRLSLFARPTAEEFLAKVAKGLPPSDKLADKAEGLLKAHLESYSQEATLMHDQIRRLLPGQTLEIEVSSSGGLRIKAPVGVPAVSATAGFSVARQNSIAVTREGNGFVVVSKTGTSAGLAAGVSVLGNRLSASLNGGGRNAAGTVLEFAPSAGEEPPIARVAALVAGLFSPQGAEAPGKVLQAAAPDRMRCVDANGAYIGVEARANASLKLPGPLESVSLTLEAEAGASAEIEFSQEANSFTHRRSAMRSYEVSGTASAGVGETEASASASLKVTKEKTLVSELGVGTDIFTRTSVAIEVQAMNNRSEGDFYRMLAQLALPDEVTEAIRPVLDFHRRQSPVSIAVRRQLSEEFVQELANPSTSQERRDAILNTASHYKLKALEFTVAEGASEQVSAGSTSPEQMAEAGRQALDTATERVAGLQETLEQGQTTLENAVAQAREAVGEVQRIIPVAQAQQVVGNVAARVSEVAETVVPAVGAVMRQAGGSEVFGLAEAAIDVGEAALSGVQQAVDELAGFNISFEMVSAGGMRKSRLMTVDLSELT